MKAIESLIGLALLIALIGGITVIYNTANPATPIKVPRMVFSDTTDQTAAGAQTRTKDHPKMNPTSASRKIAHVEDDVNWQSIIVGIFSAGQVVTYPSCEILIANLTGNPSLNFTAYILDNNLGEGLMKGPICTESILMLRPGSVIVGFSANFGEDPGFISRGAKAFVEKTTFEIKDLLKLIPSQ